MSLFPFPVVRGGQRELMEDVEHAIADGGNLVAHAPTGIGKTVAVLAPALEHALRGGLTLFFLTPKHTQHTIVIETLRRIKEKHNPSFSVVDFIGKQWVCPHDVRDLDSREFHEFCRARKKDEACVYYNNVHRKKSQEKIAELVGSILKEPVHVEKIQLLCRDGRFCPYEVCVKAGKKADVIVCDYYHLLQPKIRGAFLTKLGKSLADSIIIVDEAHNVPERARKILSVSLTVNSLNRAGKEAAVLGLRELSEDVEKVSKVLRRLGRGVLDERYVEREEFTSGVEAKTERTFTGLADELDAAGEMILSLPNRHRSYAKSVAMFLRSWSGGDVGYARVLKKDEHILLSYQCLDPSFATKPVFDEARSVVIMSGTLTPLSMYSSLLGLSEGKTAEKVYSSPFPPENRLTLVVAGLTTKYSKRGEFMYKKYAKTLGELLHSVPGNAAVFYPAYHVMDEILKELPHAGKEVLVEKKEMGKNERRSLYDRLAAGAGKVLMGVQAGSFSEGVDYPEGMLSAVFVVGLPLEKPSLETQALIDYYDFRFERGWDFGYIYPAVNRALQAAGRCIRSEEDRGAIVLMDERFRWANYAKCFPPDYDFIVTETPEKYLRKFFGMKKSVASH